MRPADPFVRCLCHYRRRISSGARGDIPKYTLCSITAAVPPANKLPNDKPAPVRKKRKKTYRLLRNGGEDRPLIQNAIHWLVNFTSRLTRVHRVWETQASIFQSNFKVIYKRVVRLSYSFNTWKYVQIYTCKIHETDFCEVSYLCERA